MRQLTNPRLAHLYWYCHRCDGWYLRAFDVVERHYWHFHHEARPALLGGPGPPLGQPEPPALT